MAEPALPLNWSVVPTLRGRYAALEPLSAGHVDDLRAARDDVALDGLWFTNIPERDKIAAYIDAALQDKANGGSLPFAVLDAGGEVVGTTRFYDIDTAAPRLTIGYTWYAPRVQRTGVNTEAKLLLLQHAFEVLGCIGVGFETSSHNARSRAAIARLGAKQDGILRHHKRHADGSVRDTVVFSIIDTEWPAVKRGLLEKLQKHEVPANA